MKAFTENAWKYHNRDDKCMENLTRFLKKVGK